MRKMDVSEMRMVDGGGVSFLAIAFGWYLGKYLGINAKIISDHLKYGECYTYPKYCSTCKKR